MKTRQYQNPVGVGKFTGLLLILPFIIGFLVFIAYPFFASLILGMTENSGGEARFAGTSVFRHMLSDSSFRKAVGVTVRYALILVPLKTVVSLFIAMLLNLELKGIGVYRTVFYIPSILGSNLAVVIMWQFLFTSGGLVNQLLGLAGASPVSWYGDTRYALYIIVLLRLWEFGSAMVIFLNALRDIPKEYYEAARVDGCGKVRGFFSITLPLLRNVVFLNLVLQTIAAMQEFSAPYMITGGGPLKSTETVGLMIYNEMFRYGDISYANAVSWGLFMLITAAVLLLFAVTGKHREDEV
ncbi:MAG TPA: sugar ABC transporter permease [Ruminococcus sp.]|nr:sugar ABC transporter permease [Ruminococcus sp.]